MRRRALRNATLVALLAVTLVAPAGAALPADVEQCVDTEDKDCGDKECEEHPTPHPHPPVEHCDDGETVYGSVETDRIETEHATVKEQCVDTEVLGLDDPYSCDDAPH